MDGLDQLFHFFYQEVKANPWNLFPNFPEYISSDLVSKIRSEWNEMPQDSKLGFLIAVLIPYKRKVTPSLKDCVVQLLDVALQDDARDVVLMANCIKNWIEFGYLDLSLYKESDAFKSIQHDMDAMMKDIKWIPEEVEFLSAKVLESYHLPDMNKEGLILKQGHFIPSLQERMKKYGVDHVEDSVESPSVVDREKKSSASFLRRASRGSVTSPSSSLPKAKKSLKDSKAVTLDLKEIESLQMEQAKEKKKLEDEKLKKQKEKEDAKEAKKLEKSRLEEEKKRTDQLKKEQEKIKEEERKKLLQKKKEMAAQKRQEEVEKPKRKGSSNAESDAKKVKIAPSQRVLNVIGDADLCTSEDLILIEDFLQGRYKIHEEMKQICLKERIYEDEQGNSKKEAIILILDYSQCKWRKIRKTFFYPSAIQVPTVADTPSTTDTRQNPSTDARNNPSSTETPQGAESFSSKEATQEVEIPAVEATKDVEMPTVETPQAV